MQRTDEWLKNYNKDYFDRQFHEPYRSTVAFCDWLENLGVLEARTTASILDIGTGKGANIYYMAKRFRAARFTGVDINPEFINEGNKILKNNGVHNQCELKVGDIYRLDSNYVDKVTGVVSYQTLSWLPDYAAPIKEMARLNPRWIALTSLFYDGDVNCKIEIEEYNKSIDEEPKKTFYNIYSLRLIEKLFKNLGYSKFIHTYFEIDIDIPKPNHTIMGTYTEKLANGKRIQISGPLLMNWYFILAYNDNFNYEKH